MRRALGATAMAAGIALAGAPFAAPALADDAPATSVVASGTETDTDEPLAEDGNDDTGKYGLIGLTGLLGLFGYKKYKDHRTARHHTSGPTGGAGTGGSGSPRV